MLFFAREYFFQHAACRRVLVSQVADHLPVTLDRNSLGNQILFDHALEGVTFDVLRMTARRQSIR